MKIRIVAPLLLALALPSCAGNFPNLPTPGQVDAVIEGVQTTTEKICRFIPTAQTVAAVLDALGVGGGASVITNVAGQICNAVTKKSAKRFGTSQPTVAGVVIRGYFVR